MGYCVDWDLKIQVPKNNVQKALDAINELMKPENVKKNGRGGSWSHGGQTDWWYSWVSTPPDNKYNSLKEAFVGWGFNAKEREDGSVTVNSCYNEKLGQEELFLEAIARYVTDDSSIYVHGEDGANWRWVFKNGHLIEQQGRVIYEE